MDTCQKRKQLFHEINKMKDTGGLYELINQMDIPRTKNSNGIFVNLSVIDEDDIHALSELVGKLSYYQSADVPEHVFPPEPEPDITKTKVAPKVHIYKPIKLTSIQRTILSHGIW